MSRKGVGADGSPRFYAARAWQEDGRQKGEMLQNFILGVKSIDHVNDDTLDNRKVNLRPATHAQNGQNNRRYGTNTSGVTGVYLDKRRGTWFAAIFVNRTQIHLGTFKAFEDAVAARREAEERYHPFSTGRNRGDGHDLELLDLELLDLEAAQCA